MGNTFVSRGTYNACEAARVRCWPEVDQRRAALAQCEVDRAREATMAGPEALQRVKQLTTGLVQLQDTLGVSPPIPHLDAPGQRRNTLVGYLVHPGAATAMEHDARMATPNDNPASYQVLQWGGTADRQPLAWTTVRGPPNDPTALVLHLRLRDDSGTLHIACQSQADFQARLPPTRFLAMDDGWRLCTLGTPTVWRLMGEGTPSPFHPTRTANGGFMQFLPCTLLLSPQSWPQPILKDDLTLSMNADPPISRLYVAVLGAGCAAPA